MARAENASSAALVQDIAIVAPAAAPAPEPKERPRSARRTSGHIGLDNYGSKYYGRERVLFGLNVESPLAIGDQLAVQGNYSRERTAFGSVGYSLPVGAAGWRAHLDLIRSEYRLGGEFAVLRARGKADTASFGFSYPLLQGTDYRLDAKLSVQGKRLRDDRNAEPRSSARKRTQLVPLVLSGYHRDRSAVTYGSMGLTFGRLELDAALSTLDEAAGRTMGAFRKFNIDIARTQNLGARWSVHGRLVAQQANKSLDSSEKMALGGAYGVRAWPSGEAIGDGGWLGQFELRYQLGQTEPYLFIDAGRVRSRLAGPNAAASKRGIEGGGIGLRWKGPGAWRLDAAAARRAGNEVSVAEPGAKRMRALLSLGYHF